MIDRYKKHLFVLAGVFAYLLVAYIFPPDPGNDAVNQTAGIALLMAIWWLTEALPLGVTALVPFIMFPLTGVTSSGKVASSYMNSTIFLFIGGFLLAIAMEKWNLHKRIAVEIISIFGTSTRALLGGFMISGYVLSMWVSNTATAIMLLPMALAIILEVEKSFEKKDHKFFTNALLLGIAYSCSAGGIATLVGTPPNLVFQRIYSITFPNATQVSFAGWMLIGFPISLVV